MPLAGTARRTARHEARVRRSFPEAKKSFPGRSVGGVSFRKRFDTFSRPSSRWILRSTSADSTAIASGHRMGTALSSSLAGSRRANTAAFEILSVRKGSASAVIPSAGVFERGARWTATALPQRSAPPTLSHRAAGANTGLLARSPSTSARWIPTAMGAPVAGTDRSGYACARQTDALTIEGA